MTRGTSLYDTWQTIWSINSCIVKLGKLTQAAKVYRGVGGRNLPSQLKQKNQYGVIGAVDYAFISTTLDRTVAQVGLLASSSPPPHLLLASSSPPPRLLLASAAPLLLCSLPALLLPTPPPGLCASGRHHF